MWLLQSVVTSSTCHRWRRTSSAQYNRASVFVSPSPTCCSSSSPWLFSLPQPRNVCCDCFVGGKLCRRGLSTWYRLPPITPVTRFRATTAPTRRFTYRRPWRRQRAARVIRHQWRRWRQQRARMHMEIRRIIVKGLSTTVEWSSGGTVCRHQPSKTDSGRSSLKRKSDAVMWNAAGDNDRRLWQLTPQTQAVTGAWRAHRIALLLQGPNAKKFVDE